MKTCRSFTIIFMLCLMASSAYAFEMPNFHFFQPTPDDLSRWYLGNIFGSDLVPGSNVPNMQLLGKLFGIFNQVALVVTIIIVTYTIGAGTLNTASEGKALGEKWNAVWMPIRIVVGIAMLVPKPGAGYCLAQYMIMWIIMGGVGAADTLWGKMLDYFEAGGAVSVVSTEDKPLMFSYDNMNYTYSLQTDQSVGGGGYGAPKDQPADMLKSLVCVEAFNNDPANKDAPPRKAYLASATFTEDLAPYPILMFGDPKQFNYNMPINDNQSGSECGYIKYKVNMNQSDKEIKKEPERATIYMSALLVMANKLDDLAKVIVTTSQADDDVNFPRQYTDVQRSMQLFVNYIVSYRNILAPVRDKAGNLQLYKQFGWILAGNYYSVLANFQEKAMLQEQQFVLPVYDFIYKGPISKEDPNGNYPRASSFYTDTYFTSSPDPMYAVPGSEYKQDLEANQPAPVGAISPVTRSKADALKNAVAKNFNDTALSGATKKRVDEFMKYLTGKGKTGLSAQNPITSAAKYGKLLTEISLVMITGFGAAWVLGVYLAAPMSGLTPFKAAAATFFDIVSPMVVALGGFLYTMGATLGIFIPLIPYVTFLTGVVGFMLAVVESIAAAPLVCMGLIFPETKDEIWGRAAPAYMLVLNLFLRPSLMIIGFAAAMILMWVITEVLNIGFLTLLGATFQIENMFGFVTILTVYVTVFTYIVTEVYSLINVVPNRVLAWVGDQSMGVKGAKEAIGAAKQGTEAGAGAAVGGYEAVSQKADMWRVQEHKGDSARLEREVDKRLQNATDKDDPNARDKVRQQIMKEGGPPGDDGTPTGAKAGAGAKPPGAR